jgi:hypothetical protein
MNTLYPVQINLSNTATVTATVTATIGPDGTPNTYVPNFYRFYAKRLSASTTASSPVVLTLSDGYTGVQVFELTVSTSQANVLEAKRVPLFTISGSGQIIATAVLPASSSLQATVWGTYEEYVGVE